MMIITNSFFKLKVTRIGIFLTIAINLPIIAKAEEIRMPGFIYSKNTQDISVSGGLDWNYKIAQIVPEGQNVKPGEVILVLDGVNEEKWKSEQENSFLQQRSQEEGTLDRLKNQIVQIENEIANSKKEIDIIKLQGNSTPNDYTPGLEVLKEKLDFENRQLKLKLMEEKLIRKKNQIIISKQISEKTKQIIKTNIDKFAISKENGIKKSTISGIVVYKLINGTEKPKAGGMVYNGQNILSVMDEKNLYVNAYLKEEQFNKIATGEELQVKILGQKEETTTGKIVKISSVVLNIATWEQALPSTSHLANINAFQVKIELTQIPPQAKPGGEVIIIAKTKN